MAFLHKRKRTPPVTHIDLDAGAAAATAKGRGRTSKKPVLTTAASDSGEKSQRKYTKSGMHSKDPLVAAAARANVRIPSDSEPG